uniref:Uncharacterized protein n=1 Tax=Triticum urartu TaxID=4572 RepID=A0A8R7P4R4_TRIUA
MALLPVFEEYKNNRNPQSRRDPDGRLRRKRENYGGVASRTAPRVRRGRPAGQRSARPGLRVHPHHRERGPWPPRRHRNLLPALQDPQRRRLGADGRVDGEHRRVHGVRVPEGGRRAALHQPPQARPPRRPHRGQGEPHPGRPQRPGLGGPDMAVGSCHIGAQRFGIISKGYPANQLVNTRGNEDL